MSYLNKFFGFLGDHPVLSTVVGCVLMILFGIALLFRPSIIVVILRYGTAAVSIVLGGFLLIRTLIRAAK